MRSYFRVKPLFSNSSGAVQTCLSYKLALSSPLHTVLGVIFKHNVGLQLNLRYLARVVDLHNFSICLNFLSLSCLLSLLSLKSLFSFG